MLIGDGRLISAAQYEILPLAAALDYARIALAPLLTSATERTLKLLDTPWSGLPTGLVAEAGTAESGLAHFAIAAEAITAEARLLAQPVSFELVSTSGAEGIEDRMTMAPLAARRLAEMVELGQQVLAIELLVAAQAVELRGERPLGRGTGRLLALVRERVPFMGAGDPLARRSRAAARVDRLGRAVEPVARAARERARRRVSLSRSRAGAALHLVQLVQRDVAAVAMALRRRRARAATRAHRCRPGSGGSACGSGSRWAARSGSAPARCSGMRRPGCSKSSVGMADMSASV